MSDYTPTTADIEAEYGRIGNGPERRAAFHRWLAEHDREVKAEAWENGYDAGVEDLRDADGWRAVVNPYREVSK